MKLIKPFTVALDTSHLTQWIRDGVSNSKHDRNKAEHFARALENNGIFPLLSLHHVEELCAHENADLVRGRLRFIHRLPLIAWITSDETSRTIGGVTSIMRSEALAAYRGAGYNLLDVRDTAHPSLIAFGSGRELLGDDPDLWLMLREVFLEHSRQSRDHIAITRSNVVDLSGKPLSELLAGRLRGPEDVQRQLAVIQGSYALDIERHGDKRISDPAAVAGAFVARVANMVERHPDNTADLIWTALASQGVEPSDVRPNATVGEVQDYGMFLQQMKVSTRDTGISFAELKRLVTMQQVPTWQISMAMRTHAPNMKERKGSELIDTHLACLAPYADITFVDKRTHDAFQKAFRADAELRAVCRRVARAAEYSKIPAMLPTRDI